MKTLRSAPLLLVLLTLAWGCSDDGGSGDNPEVTAPEVARQLTTDASYDGEATVSPDGGNVVFVSERSGDYALWQVAFAGGTASLLVASPASKPFFASNGDLYYSKSDTLMRIPAGGGAAVAVDGVTGSAQLSPDRDWYLWSAPEPGQFDPYCIWVQRADLSEAAVKLTSPVEGDRYPAWSPTGDRIVFSRSHPSNSNTHLYVMDADGSNLHALTDTSLDVEDRNPAWSPDGDWVAFERGGTGIGEEKLYKVKTTGETTTDPAVRLSWETAENDDDGSPCWSPNGKWIVFEADRGGNTDIYVVGEDGEPHSKARGFGSNPLMP